MDKLKFKTKREFIEEIGLSKSTFYRLIQKKNIPLTSELLSPKEEQELRNALGFPQEIKSGGPMGQIGTDWDRLGQAGSIPE
jgi:predicted DNA-binding transcriptional regulator AlpA